MQLTREGWSEESNADREGGLLFLHSLSVAHNLSCLCGAAACLCTVRRVDEPVAGQQLPLVLQIPPPLLPLFPLLPLI